MFKDIQSLSFKSKLWVATATLATLICSVIAEPNNYIGITGAIAGILFVAMVANKKISTFFYGAIFSAIYAYLAYTNKIYGDFIINAFYHLPAQFVGIYFWKRDGYEEKKEEKVKELDPIDTVMLIIGTIMLIYVLYPILLIVGSSFAIRDTATNVYSITAMILMVKGYREQWIFWIAVNSISVYMWMSIVQNTGSGYATLIQWIVFLANSLYGYYNWYIKK